LLCESTVCEWDPKI
jgi:hypothetical protein